MLVSSERTVEAVRILGAAGTGKTEQLILRIQDLFNQGISAEAIRVFCATPHAASVFRLRLSQQIGEKAHALAITTTKALALEILSSEDAQRVTGRKPALLADFEMNFLMEDMKVSGIRPARLRAILEFFYRNWTELVDNDTDWLIGAEEHIVHGLLKENLSFLQGIIEPELLNLAVRYLRVNEDAWAHLKVPHLLVDDYQCLSRASQVCVNMIAVESIWITGNANECVKVFDSYPYAAGMDEFIETHPHTETKILQESHLSAAVVAATNNLLTDECMDRSLVSVCNPCAQAGQLVVLPAAEIPEEFNNLADFLADQIERGMAAADIFVVAPNKTWSSNLARTLEKRGIASQILLKDQPLRGDLRVIDKCVAQRIYTALKLVAFPEDAVSWRCWCGYGDYLAHSSFFNSLREYAHEKDVGLVEALGLTTLDMTEEFYGTKEVLSLRSDGLDLIATTKDLTGSALLQALTLAVSKDPHIPVPDELLKLCEDMHEEDSAHNLVKRIEKNIHFPQLSLQDEAIKIGAPCHACGLSPKIVAFCGFVNGFMPDSVYFDSLKTTIEQQQRIHAHDTRQLYTTMGKATETLVFSYFTNANLENAENLKLEIERIRFEKGERRCTIAPSMFLSAIR